VEPTEPPNNAPSEPAVLGAQPTAPPNASSEPAVPGVQPTAPPNVPSDVPGVQPTAPPATPGTDRPRYVYAIGRVEPRFPSLAVEKELAQTMGRSDSAGLTDREALQSVLSDRANRYLVRQLCWVFLVEGLETYLLIPRDPGDLELLIEAVRPRPEPADMDVVIGVLGPVAPPEACGLVVPVVALEQLYSFDRDTLLDAILVPEGMEEAAQERFRAASSEVLDRILQLSDNAGATDEHRALNYLAMKYHAIYGRTAQAHLDNASLSSVEVRPSRLGGVRTVVDVVFSYTDRQTDVTDKSFVRVDVTEQFPFLVTKLSPFYDRS
jgi:PatG C-terminal